MTDLELECRDRYGDLANAIIKFALTDLDKTISTASASSFFSGNWFEDLCFLARIQNYQAIRAEAFSKPGYIDGFGKGHPFPIPMDQTAAPIARKKHQRVPKVKLIAIAPGGEPSVIHGYNNAAYMIGCTVTGIKSAICSGRKCKGWTLKKCEEVNP